MIGGENYSGSDIGMIDEEKKAPGEIELEQVEDESIKNPFDGVVVFGHGWSKKGWRLSWEAKARALAAYELWKNGAAPKIILTGGKPGPSSFVEHGDDILPNCEQMKAYLVDRLNVPEEAIILEDEPGSSKTVDNVGLALNTLDRENLKSDNFITVSTAFHLERITKIMDRYGLKSEPVYAEKMLAEISKDHAEKMKEKDIKKGLSEDEINKNYNHRIGLYPRMLEKIMIKDQTYFNELKNEPKWNEAMEKWGYYGPLLLSVKGERLKQLVARDKDQTEAWLERHPDIDVTIEDLIEGNFDYRNLVEKGREMPQ